MINPIFYWYYNILCPTKCQALLSEIKIQTLSFETQLSVAGLVEKEVCLNQIFKTSNIDDEFSFTPGSSNELFHH